MDLEPIKNVGRQTVRLISVNMSAVCFCKPGDYWGVFFDLNRQIKEAFDEHNIEIPFPQRVVHMVNAA